MSTVEVTQLNNIYFKAIESEIQTLALYIIAQQNTTICKKNNYLGKMHEVK